MNPKICMQTYNHVLIAIKRALFHILNTEILKRQFERDFLKAMGGVWICPHLTFKEAETMAWPLTPNTNTSATNPPWASQTMTMIPEGY